jgi:transposase
MSDMQNAASTGSSELTEVSALSAGELAVVVRSQAEKIAALEHQLEWFRRQLFGQKSERFAPEPDPSQMHLGEVFPVPAQPIEKNQSIPAHTRRITQTDGAESGEELKFFDESKVPVQTIILMHADVEGLSPEQYEVIGEKVTYRIAQRPGNYQILKYRRPVVKIKSTARLLALPAPEGILEGSRADVSFVAGLLLDKFAWHLPLYRQHQRLAAGGIRVSRQWLTQLAQASISLLAPIYEAQFDSIRASRVKAMDETPIKAGRAGHRKMHTGYFWPVYGELDEICFPFHTSRSGDFVCSALGLEQWPSAPRQMPPAPAHGHRASRRRSACASPRRKTDRCRARRRQKSRPSATSPWSGRCRKLDHPRNRRTIDRRAGGSGSSLRRVVAAIAGTSRKRRCT